MPKTLAIPEHKVQLHDISWETYERLLAEVQNSCGTRFAYDRGELEIMQVYYGHEGPHRELASLVQLTAVETRGDFEVNGSATLVRRDLAQGFEPDTSYYFRHAKAMRSRRELDLATDPPPELIIEVDIVRSSLNRFAIFAGIGIEEVWRYDGEEVRFHALAGGAYAEIPVSKLLPPMTSAQATIFLHRCRRDKAYVWMEAVRDWVRAQRRNI